MHVTQYPVIDGVIIKQLGVLGGMHGFYLGINIQ